MCPHNSEDIQGLGQARPLLAKWYLVESLVGIYPMFDVGTMLQHWDKKDKKADLLPFISS